MFSNKFLLSKLQKQ